MKKTTKINGWKELIEFVEMSEWQIRYRIGWELFPAGTKENGRLHWLVADVEKAIAEEDARDDARARRDVKRKIGRPLTALKSGQAIIIGSFERDAFQSNELIFGMNALAEFTGLCITQLQLRMKDGFWPKGEKRKGIRKLIWFKDEILEAMLQEKMAHEYNRATASGKGRPKKIQPKIVFSD